MRFRAPRLGAKAAVLLAALVTAGFSAQAAAAEPLTGESFVAGPFGDPNPVVITSQSCTPMGGSFNYSVEGTAAGPVPGFFTEAGTVVLGPEVAFQRPVLSLEADFTIREDVGGTPGQVIVEGFKRLFDPLLAGFAECTSNTSEITLDTEGLCYAAQFIGTAETDRGRSVLHLETGPVGEVLPAFFELFDSDPTVSCTRGCPPDDDEDGDGLTDHNESTFGTLLGLQDSDSDGTVDGNEDSDDDGEDDEDEDDDDECPDEDSDDDGEDDEDEDDDEDD